MAIPSNITPEKKRLVVLCDGTWCGRETNTESNIHILARMMGVNFNRTSTRAKSPKGPYTSDLTDPDKIVAYFEGIGLGNGANTVQYVLDGALASTIDDECLSVYEFIVEHFDSSSEVWMFGLSRGAYTVRCVAGMINNTGILDKTVITDPKSRKILCGEIYKVYRSPYQVDHPNSPQALIARARQSVHSNPTPIKFMGLLDTVGSLGIPQFSSGIGGNFEYPQLHSQEIGGAVENVYHALSVHDRLWAFQPCFALQASNEDGTLKNPNQRIKEVWFPGCHYDLGRQRFHFVRTSDSIIQNIIQLLPSILSEDIKPNQVLSDIVLKWMLKSIQEVDSTATLVPNIDRIIKLLGVKRTYYTQPNSVIDNASENDLKMYRSQWEDSPEMREVFPELLKGGFISKKEYFGSGDVYNDLVPYMPFGKVLSGVFSAVKFAAGLVPFQNKFATTLLADVGTSVFEQLLSVRDRRIPDCSSEIEHYTYEDLGEVSSTSKVRYASMTRENFYEWKAAFGP